METDSTGDNGNRCRWVGTPRAEAGRWGPRGPPPRPRGRARASLKEASAAVARE